MKVYYKIADAKNWDGICNITDCFHRRTCAQCLPVDFPLHRYGTTPDLKLIQNHVCCSKIDTEIDNGGLALTKNGDFVLSYKINLDELLED